MDQQQKKLSFGLFDLFSEDYAREPVPLSKRVHWMYLFMIWMAMGVDLAAFYLGAAFSQGNDLLPVILAIVGGSMILMPIAFCSGWIGASTGLSFAMIARKFLGRFGAIIVLLVILANNIGWFGVQIGFFGEAASATLAEWVGIEIAPLWWMILGGILMTLTAAWGFKAISNLSALTVPLMVGLLISLIFASIFTDLTITPPIGGDEGMPIGLIVSLVAGAWMVGSIAATPDVARFAKNKIQAGLSCAFGIGIGNSLTAIIAVILYFITGADNVVDVMFRIGGGGIALLIMMMATWTSNDNALYSSGLALTGMMRNIPKSALTIWAGLIGTVVGVLGIYDNLTTFLFILTPLIAPVGGILYVDYFLLNNHKYKMAFVRQDNPPMFKPLVLTVWALATLLTFCTTPSGEGGFGIFNFTTIPVLDGIIFSTVLYYIFGKTQQLVQNRTEDKKTSAA
ncbi:purine-cytosine permease family protein [Desmospora activa]|uniref:purine-cytosine permease family protein n=1 Tax=Desmospora activa TaxID=500615 RepID=UPI0014730386|nr:cytosine permease [Desmospora activa]